AAVPQYPQITLNIPATPEEKTRKLASPELREAEERARRSLSGRGKIIIRPSGTENLIRVTAEAEKEATAKKIVEELAEILRNTP
ncbi:MAG: phosphoglucosamine mutase, partial [Oscillospiraceae bacterium]|nr:phosphoglucosamine mutase [Oscillospiraceae bacterium]